MRVERRGGGEKEGRGVPVASRDTREPDIARVQGRNSDRSIGVPREHVDELLRGLSSESHVVGPRDHLIDSLVSIRHK